MTVSVVERSGARFSSLARLTAALEPDTVVLGGGNVNRLKVLPPLCRAGDNANAFVGGFRLWERADPPALTVAGTHERRAILPVREGVR